MQHPFGGDDRRAGAAKGSGVPGRPPAEQGLTGIGNRLVAADMIGIAAGVDDVPDRRGRDPLDGGEDRVGARCEPGVGDEDAVLPHLDGDVPAGAGDHEEVGAQLDHVEIATGGHRVCLDRRRPQAGLRIDHDHAGHDGDQHGCGHGEA